MKKLLKVILLFVLIAGIITCNTPTENKGHDEVTEQAADDSSTVVSELSTQETGSTVPDESVVAAEPQTTVTTEPVKKPVETKPAPAVKQPAQPSTAVKTEKPKPAPVKEPAPQKPEATKPAPPPPPAPDVKKPEPPAPVKPAEEPKPQPKPTPPPSPPPPPAPPAPSANNWAVPANYVNMANPVKADKASLDQGKSLYNKHCASCHGKSGLGDGPKAATLDTPSGDFSSNAFQKQTDGALFYKTIEGRKDMPGYKKKIPEKEDIWSIVNYMRTFK